MLCQQTFNLHNKVDVHVPVNGNFGYKVGVLTLALFDKDWGEGTV